MTKDEIINKNKELISSYLKKIIGNNTINLIGVPKHMNLGDTLIWESELDIFDLIGKKPKHTYFFYTNTEDMKISNNEIIIWNGGGYFGDVWNFIEYSNDIFKAFKDNKMIFMPNSVWFNEPGNIKIVYERLKTHNNRIYLITRDKQSFNIANKLFSDLNNVEISMLPDVVLAWDIKNYMYKRNMSQKEGSGTLYINREDKEKKNSEYKFHFDKKSDWPTIMKLPEYINTTYNCEEWEKEVKNKLIDEAIQFILPYKIVVSERMHGAILAWLLDKETVLLDNSYGKSKALYDTWFNQNQDDIKCV